MDYYFIKRTLLDCGVSLHSATEPSLDDTGGIAGKVFETFSALQAEIDNTLRRERSIRGMGAKLAAGIYPWKPPLGYRCAQNRLRGVKKLEPDEPDSERFPLIVKLFRICREQQIRGNVELANLATAWGLRTHTGARVYPQLIDYILGNPFYAGILTNPWTKEQSIGRHEAAISPEHFREVQLIRRGKRTPLESEYRLENPDFPLRRSVFCRSCKTSFTGSWSRGNGGRYAYYHCRSRRCAQYGKAIPKETIESAFSKILSAVTPDPAAIKCLYSAIELVWRERHAERQLKAERTVKRVYELEARLNSLIGMRERELLNDQEFLARKNRLLEELHEAQAAEMRLPQKDSDPRQWAYVVGRFIRLFPKTWKRTRPRLRRRFQQAIFPNGIDYAPEDGFGTPNLGLIYTISQSSEPSRAALVRRVRASWNRLIEDLNSLHADISSDPDAESVKLERYQGGRLGRKTTSPPMGLPASARSRKDSRAKLHT